MDQQLKQFIKETYPRDTKNINISITYQKRIGTQGAIILAQNIKWDIKQLNLNMYGIQDEGMQEIIAAGKNWHSLTEIFLERNGITCEGLVNIKQAPWSHLKKITLNKNSIKAKGFSYIVEANWPELQFLDLSHNEIGLEGAMLFSLINWPNLRILNLNYNLIGNEGMRQLSKCNFCHLQQLQLSNNKLDAKAMFYLSTMELPNLISLTLNRNQIGRNNKMLSELGCIYLSKLKVEGIKYLHIFGNDITLNGMKQILYSGKLAQNCFLEVIRNLFNFSQIQQDVLNLKFFCNVFE